MLRNRIPSTFMGRSDEVPVFDTAIFGPFWSVSTLTLLSVAFLGLFVLYSAFTGGEQMALFLGGMLMVRMDITMRSRTDTRSSSPLASIKDINNAADFQHRVF
jgi:hypothetical protein